MPSSNFILAVLQRPPAWVWALLAALLVLILGIFATKFCVGVSLARHPELRHDPAFAIGASLACGVFSGVFAGHALALWRLAHPQPAVRMA